MKESIHNLDDLNAILSNSIGYKRYEHTLRVLDCARHLAAVYNIDEQKVAVAALLHDCGREVKIDDSIKYAQAHGLKINKTESLQPILLHARIGRLIAKSKYAITDKQILNAIAYHTTGHKDMDSVAMVVYIADMLEAERDFDGVEQLRSLVGKVGLVSLMLSCVHATLEYLLSTGSMIHINSIKTYNHLLVITKQEKNSKLRSVSL